MNLAAGALWYVPGSFDIVRMLGPRYSVRSVLFHDVSDTESSFTRGLAGTITRKNFEVALRFLTKHYSPVSLEDVLASFDGKPLPLRPVLITFDDAYASVAEFAAPLCAKFGVPALFFVNAACLDNKQLALDNLVCYVANVCGLETVNAAIRSVNGTGGVEVHSLTGVFSDFLPRTSLSVREAFRQSLIELTGIRQGDLAAEAGLYLSNQQLRDLSKFNFEIGNHTYSHPNCRTLSTADLAGEIDRNKIVLEAISGTTVRSFSVPYGSSIDLTTDLAQHLRRSGYKAVFLAEGGANSSRNPESNLDRVSIKASTDAAFFSEIEVLPRLRRMRNWVLAASSSESAGRYSHVEKAMPTTWNADPQHNSAIGSDVPRRGLGL